MTVIRFAGRFLIKAAPWRGCSLTEEGHQRLAIWHSGTCAVASASPQKWPPSHWSPAGSPPEGHSQTGHSSVWQKHQIEKHRTTCQSTEWFWNWTVCHLQIRSCQSGTPQVTVFEFGVLQRGHTEVYTSHLTALHIHPL